MHRGSVMHTILDKLHISLADSTSIPTNLQLDNLCAPPLVSGDWPQLDNEFELPMEFQTNLREHWEIIKDSLISSFGYEMAVHVHAMATSVARANYCAWRLNEPTLRFHTLAFHTLSLKFINARLPTNDKAVGGFIDLCCPSNEQKIQLQKAEAFYAVAAKSVLCKKPRC